VPTDDPEDDASLDDTVRNLRILADAPGDLRFRQNIVSTFNTVSKNLHRLEIRVVKLEDKQIPRIDVAAIAKKEIEVLENKVDTLSKMVWGLGGAIAAGLITIMLARIFK
jgi:hypothetical protein